MPDCTSRPQVKPHKKFHKAELFSPFVNTFRRVRKFKVRLPPVNSFTLAMMGNLFSLRDNNHNNWFKLSLCYAPTKHSDNRLPKRCIPVN